MDSGRVVDSVIRHLRPTNVLERPGVTVIQEWATPYYYSISILRHFIAPLVVPNQHSGYWCKHTFLILISIHRRLEAQGVDKMNIVPESLGIRSWCFIRLALVPPSANLMKEIPEFLILIKGRTNWA
jgi:hypothetical protein